MATISTTQIECECGAQFEKHWLLTGDRCPKCGAMICLKCGENKRNDKCWNCEVPGRAVLRECEDCLFDTCNPELDECPKCGGTLRIFKI